METVSGIRTETSEVRERSREAEEQRSRRLDLMRHEAFRQLDVEFEENKRRHREGYCVRMAVYRQKQTEEQKRLCRERDRVRMAAYRQRQTEEEKRQRRERARVRMSIARRSDAAKARRREQHRQLVALSRSLKKREQEDQSAEDDETMQHLKERHRQFDALLKSMETEAVIGHQCRQRPDDEMNQIEENDSNNLLPVIVSVEGSAKIFYES